MKTIQTLALSLLLLLFVGCIDDFDNSTTETGEGPDIVMLVESNLSGVLYRFDGKPLQEVTVSVRDYTTVTNIYGKYEFKDILLDVEHNLVTYSREGYFSNYKITKAQPGQDLHIRTYLQTKLIRGTFDSASGGDVGETTPRVQLSFPPNAIVDSDGNAYQGEVSVFERSINQNDPLFTLLTPGNLSAITLEEEEVILESYAMAAIELNGSDGEELNLAPGKEAILSFPIIPELQSIAPEKIPLWYFDESSGKWIEEGSATMLDGRYVGAVSHFSFWNCDIPRDVVEISMTLVDAQGVPYSNLKVNLMNEALGLFSGSGQTDDNGYVSGLIPANVELTLQVLIVPFNCGEGLTTTLPPISSDMDLGTIVVDGAIPIRTAKGRVVDCDGQPMSNVEITLDTREFFTTTTDDQGIFSFNLGPCIWGGNYYYQSFDPVSETYSRLYSKSGTLPEVEDLGDVVHCHVPETVITLGNQCCIDQSTVQLSATMEWVTDSRRQVYVVIDDGDKLVEIDFKIFDREDLLQPLQIDCIGYDIDGFSNSSSGGGGGGVVDRFSGRGLPGEQITATWMYDDEDDYYDNIDHIFEFTVTIDE